MTSPVAHPATGASSGRPGEGAVAGARWLTVAQVVTQVTRTGVQILLARLLLPSDFGLMAMALVVTNFLDIFRDLGTRAAIIQRREVTPTILSSLFYVNVGFGVALSLGVALLAPLAAALLGDGNVTPVLQVLGLSIALSSFGLVQLGLLYRDMRYRWIGALHVTSALVQAGVSVGLALSGFGVWSLVGGTLAGALASTLLAWLASSWRPSWSFSASEVRSVWSFSLNLSGSHLVGFLVGNLDKVIIGRLLGTTSLGYYTLAQRILMYPIRSITQMAQEVLLPSMARRQDDDEALTDQFMRAGAVIALTTFPLMAIAAVLAEPFVRVVLGEQWLPAAPLIAVLGPVGALQSLNYTVSALYQAKGRTDWLLRFGVVAGVVYVLGYVIGARWGLMGVAVGYTVAVLVLTYPAFAIPFRLIGASTRAYARVVAPFAVGAILASAAARGTLELLATMNVIEPVALALAAPAGLVPYALLLWLLRPGGVDDAARVVGLGRLLRN
ncbi:lipopolysaccharide biosynthesis protein [Egibacter rhizosphaerae]|uniref:Lipopolysaccharide biosynthesis protein n=1 Tax=Egibacter rhizosphaerae TaxID=1670831 RepID=A0A411YG91_9ACTN|nr:lipopolysaccharide biosynthesis protein [Egibacter rhizosphaerae]QBI20295.1 lipopolysaccharide biosynthesis protein [Egibacter rhizosphaerae]